MAGSIITTPMEKCEKHRTMFAKGDACEFCSQEQVQAEFDALVKRVREAESQRDAAYAVLEQIDAEAKNDEKSRKLFLQSFYSIGRETVYKARELLAKRYP